MSSDFIGNPVVQTVIVTILGGLWTLFKTSSWWDKIMNRRRQRALEVVEAAVWRTYEEYVRGMKQASENGKLSLNERREAQERARQNAVDYGMDRGIDIVAEYGEAYLMALINRVVARQKSSLGTR